ncbi:MAG TPA: hypothetical protein VGF48_05815 [Thermoanaerobaculia bacterium]|jgi:hypothetical protein
MTEGILPKTFHCRRCHRDLPMAEYVPHYKTCPGFAGKCYETCPPTAEPTDQSRKAKAPGRG